MKHPGLFSYIVAFIMVATAAAQEMAVPIDLQYSLFVKILSYDRALMSKSKDNITIGIAYQRRYPTSRNAKDEFIDNILNSPENQIPGRTIKYIEIDIMDGELQEIIESRQIDVLYLTPIRAYSIDTIVGLCRNFDILSLSSVPEYCNSGLSVSIGQKGEKPDILINLDAARQEGSDFSSQLLKLATIL